MGDETISTQELAKLADILPDILQRIDTLDELVVWFQTQPYVVSVDLSNYLLKTEPPRKELFVQFRIDDGSTIMTAIAITLCPDQTFKLADIYTP